MSIGWLGRLLNLSFLRGKWFRSAAFFLLAVVLLIGIRISLWRPLDVVGSGSADGWIRVNGAIHVHTTFSDGGGSPEEVIEAAKKIGLQFVVITDHRVLEAKKWEGYHGNLLVIVGSELSTDAGHLLALGIPDPPFRFSGDVQDVMSDIRSLNGVAIVAHPMNARQEFRWSGWELPGPWGMEVFNGDSQWRNTPRLKLAGLLCLYPLNWRYAMLQSMTYPKAEIQKWDYLLAQRDVTGIAGADAHNRVSVTRDRYVRFPSYEASMSLVRNHVLLPNALSGNSDVDRNAILTAISKGRLYLGMDGLAPANDFFFTAKQDGKTWTMGDSFDYGSEPFVLQAGGKLPKHAKMRLLHNGVVVSESVGSLEWSSTMAGIYRIEVQVADWALPWIISNPIYAFDSNTIEKRKLRLRWPGPEPLPDAIRVLDSFDEKSGFAIESDAHSSAHLQLKAKVTSGAELSTARLDFQLGIPKQDGSDSFCALTDRHNQDLSEFQGLLIRMKADGVYRMWIQVRDENLLAGPEGTEAWLASIRTSTDWQTIAVPFSKLRSNHPESDGLLDLEHVQALVLMLDSGSIRPGTAGTIWLDQIALY